MSVEKLGWKPCGSGSWSGEEWEIFMKIYGDSSPDGFAFDGDDFCNDGAGGCSWDGISHRCDCGNRRMYWYFDLDWVYPEAY